MHTFQPQLIFAHTGQESRMILDAQLDRRHVGLDLLENLVHKVVGDCAGHLGTIAAKGEHRLNVGAIATKGKSLSSSVAPVLSGVRGSV